MSKQTNKRPNDIRVFDQAYPAHLSISYVTAGMHHFSFVFANAAWKASEFLNFFSFVGSTEAYLGTPSGFHQSVGSDSKD
jgi:hypothetical protein